MSPIAEKYDALFVINQDINSREVVRQCLDKGYRKVLLVTTHRLFKEELTFLRGSADLCDLCVSSFIDWLDDAGMAWCDEQASVRLLPSLSSRVVRWTYASLFTAESLYLKNALVCQSLQRKYQWKDVYYADGLGVSPRLWEERGARRIGGGAAPLARRVAPKILRKWRFAQQFLMRTTRLDRLQYKECTLFFTSTRRLAFRSEVLLHPLTINPLTKLRAAIAGRTLNPSQILRRIVGKKAVLATTVHQYPRYLVDDSGPVKVFIDGFHPSNYPRAYLDQYGECVFVGADPLSCEWFTKYGKTVSPAPEFIAAEPMRMPTSTGRVRRLLLALNHAGDWTALINRSDTDILVESFCNLAESFPHIEFVVRPHPTMNHPDHEGRRSQQRLEKHVSAQRHANIRVSRGPLSEDLDSCDLVISEYSQVLIDAWRIGKLGLIANLTGRRSFMIDYEACGFPHVEDEVGLAIFLRNIEADTSSLAGIQQRAAQCYNAKFEAWRNRDACTGNVVGMHTVRQTLKEEPHVP